MSPKEVLRAFHAAFVARDVEALCALYADDAVNHQVAEAPLRGKAAIRKGFEEFFRAFPGETSELLNLFEDGEWAIWEWRGGNPDAAPGAPAIPRVRLLPGPRRPHRLPARLLGQADVPQGARAGAAGVSASRKSAPPGGPPGSRRGAGAGRGLRPRGRHRPRS
jgi:hypothetical protein